jgi:hypothetical protein
VVNCHWHNVKLFPITEMCNPHFRSVLMNNRNLVTVLHSLYYTKQKTKNSHHMDMLVKPGHYDIREISSSHGGEYDVQSCLLGYTAV